MMIEFFKDWVLHLDKHLETVIQACGLWTYPLLFLVIFCETGLVVTPYLPGDSLLFAAGAIAAKPDFHIDATILFIVLAAAAILGDTVNYWIGAYIGPRAFTGKVRFSEERVLGPHASLL